MQQLLICAVNEWKSLHDYVANKILTLVKQINNNVTAGTKTFCNHVVFDRHGLRLNIRPCYLEQTNYKCQQCHIE